MQDATPIHDSDFRRYHNSRLVRKLFITYCRDCAVWLPPAEFHITFKNIKEHELSNPFQHDRLVLDALSNQY